MRGVLRSLADFERRRGRPVRVHEVHAGAAGEGVAAALGDRVDHAAGETAVLRGNAGGQHLRLLDRVLDEQVLRLREQVVVHVDAVDHEDVVEGHGAVDHHLPRVGRVLGDAGRQRRDPLEGARRGERFNLLVFEVGADDRGCDRRRLRGGDLDDFAHAARLNGDVLLDGEAERQRHRPLHVAKAAQGEGERVGARGKRGERIVAIGVADGCARALERRRRGGDRGAGNGQTLLVFHDAADGAGLNTLSENGRRGGEE